MKVTMFIIFYVLSFTIPMFYSISFLFNMKDKHEIFLFFQNLLSNIGIIMYFSSYLFKNIWDISHSRAKHTFHFTIILKSVFTCIFKLLYFIFWNLIISLPYIGGKELPPENLMVFSWSQNTYSSHWGWLMIFFHNSLYFCTFTQFIMSREICVS